MVPASPCGVEKMAVFIIKEEPERFMATASSSDGVPWRAMDAEWDEAAPRDTAKLEDSDRTTEDASSAVSSGFYRLFSFR